MRQWKMQEWKNQEHLAKLNVVDYEKCVQCKTCAETVKHFLLQCPNSDLCGKVVAACNSMGVNTAKIGLSHGWVLDVIYKTINRQL